MENYNFTSKEIKLKKGRIKMKYRIIKFECNAVKWFDKINGNTYHSVRITSYKTGETIAARFQTGYEDHYKQTALQAMLEAGWLPKKYNRDNLYLYDRENNYCINWMVRDGIKRDCIANGKI